VKRLKGLRTIILNALAGVPAAFAALYAEIKADSVDLSSLLPPARAASIIAGLALLNVLVRVFWTTGPVAEGLNAPPEK